MKVLHLQIFHRRTFQHWVFERVFHSSVIHTIALYDLDEQQSLLSGKTTPDRRDFYTLYSKLSFHFCGSSLNSILSSYVDLIIFYFEIVPLSFFIFNTLKHTGIIFNKKTPLYAILLSIWFRLVLKLIRCTFLYKANCDFWILVGIDNVAESMPCIWECFSEYLSGGIFRNYFAHITGNKEVAFSVKQ